MTCLTFYLINQETARLSSWRSWSSWCRWNPPFHLGFLSTRIVFLLMFFFRKHIVYRAHRGFHREKKNTKYVLKKIKHKPTPPQVSNFNPKGNIFMLDVSSVVVKSYGVFLGDKNFKFKVPHPRLRLWSRMGWPQQKRPWWFFQKKSRPEKLQKKIHQKLNGTKSQRTPK